MKISHSRLLLAVLLLNTMGISSFAAEEKVLEANHAYESVVSGEKKGSFALDNWIVSGDFRAGYVDYDYSNDPKNFDANINKGHKDSKGIYFIPKLSLESPDYNGFKAKITGAGVTDFGLNDELYESRTFGFGAEKRSYAILQEAYIEYEKNGHSLIIGANEKVTPMIDADDWYLLANSFQGVFYTNKTLENITFELGYFYKMAGVWDSGADGASYNSMAQTSYLDQRDKDNAGDSGVYELMFEYSAENHNFQAWNYYGVDLYNTFFAQYDYTSKYSGIEYDAGLQLIDFADVGGNEFTPIDYTIFSLKLDAKFENGFDISTGAAFYTDGPGTGATLGAWGGYSYFANGMIFHFFEAGDLRNANSYKAQLGYNFSKQGVDGLWIGTRYTYFDLDSKYSTSSSTGLGQEKQELYGIRVSYKHTSGAYFTGTYEYVDLDEQPKISALRLIGGYEF